MTELGPGAPRGTAIQLLSPQTLGGEGSLHPSTGGRARGQTGCPRTLHALNLPVSLKPVS